MLNKRFEPKRFGFRDKSKYKLHDSMDNIIVGKGELIYLKDKQAWITPSGKLITNREQAIQIATYLDWLYNINKQRIMTNKNPNK